MKSLALLISLGWIGFRAGTVVNFDSGTVGRAPAGWTVAMTNGGAPPQWRILQDQQCATQPYVLAPDFHRLGRPLPAGYPGQRHAEGWRRQCAHQARLSARKIRPGGVVWRYRDPGNYYLARVDSLTRNVVVYKVRNGVRTRVSFVAPHAIPANSWSILKVSARGDRFQVYLDHRRILQGFDRTFGSAGKVGLWTVADSVTYFDDFRVYPR